MKLAFRAHILIKMGLIFAWKVSLFIYALVFEMEDQLVQMCTDYPKNYSHVIVVTFTCWTQNSSSFQF
jgi:hypothetical protein